jgi:hypothetical protein
MNGRESRPGRPRGAYVSPQTIELRKEIMRRVLIVAQDQGWESRITVIRRLNVAERTFDNWCHGHTMPAHKILEIIELTGANPIWLLHGRGPMYHSGIPVRAPVKPSDSAA